MSQLAFFRLIAGRIERATKDSVGIDVFYSGSEPIFVGDKPVLLKTGIFTEMSPCLAAILKERSGLGLKGLEVKAGVIDADYDKEWGVVARYPMRFVHELDPNTGKFRVYRDQDWQPFAVYPGDKIAQFIIIDKPVYELVNAGGSVTLSSDERKGGFGSTDKK